MGTTTSAAFGREGDAGAGDVTPGDGNVDEKGATGSSDPPKQAAAASTTVVAISMRAVRIVVT